MVAGAGKGHSEQHRIKAGEPVLVHVREHAAQPCGQNTVAVIQEQVTGHQCHAGVNQGGHVADAENLRTLDVKVFRQQHNADANNVHRNHQAHSQLQGIHHVAGHVAGKEEANHCPGVNVAIGVLHGEHLGNGVQAGQKHETKEEIHEEGNAENLP